MEVKVYGTTAIVTGYLVGTATSPDGTATQVRSQRTEVLIKQGGQWKASSTNRAAH
jgi:ketosteroid isomerase-like protein